MAIIEPHPPATAPAAQSPVAHNSAAVLKTHRHRRSYAISGDFDFIAQMSPPPMDASHFASPSKTRYPVTPSPRFFVSEEPKYTSAFNGVPDAIINLDDAMATRPRSFKSHRRTESAPAELDVTFLQNPSLCKQFPSQFAIKEEEYSSDEDISDKNDDPQDQKLMSPLLPSPSSFKNNSRRIISHQLSNLGATDGCPALSSQKPYRSKPQQHLHPSVKHNLPSSTYNDERSTTSLCTQISPTKTLASNYWNTSTPATPLSMNKSYHLSYSLRSRANSSTVPRMRHLSPLLSECQHDVNHEQRAMKNSMSPTRSSSTFHYVSQVYDIEDFEESEVENPVRKDNSALFSESQETVTDTISSELLLGEPGGMTDLSIQTPTKHPTIDNLERLRSIDSHSPTKSALSRKPSRLQRFKKMFKR